jgi:cellulose synthase (UDP-forming)
MWPLFIYFILTIIYFLDSFIVNLLSKDFDIKGHGRMVDKWRYIIKDDVDIFLPTAGEPINVLQNTWEGIKALKQKYRGKITVYCLDDADREEVKHLASQYGFRYEVRENRGWFKKAGNLRHGYNISNGKFIAIFDADFRPRSDFLDELLPYFYEHKSVGLVQSPQYFDVHANQNWLQRGAGAVQELFYRNSQVSRQNHNASICVGSNAVYRRAALADTGGTALIEHSEDVHTGFNMRMHGWTLQYVPIILAKGLCPSDMKAFFKQQYRWCLGSMTLLTSGKFWNAQITVMARLSYFSGFIYYIHTAVSSIFIPVIPIALILLYPEQVTLQNYLYILPSIIFVQIIYPIWHRSTYGIEAWSTRTVYGWAHLFAIIDAIRNNKMQWQATGSKVGKDSRYTKFRIMQVMFNFIPAIIWIYLATEKVISGNYIFLPILVGGIYYYMMTSKVAFYFHEPMFFNKLNLPFLSWKTIPLSIFFSFSLFFIVIISVTLTSPKYSSGNAENLPSASLSNTKHIKANSENNKGPIDVKGTVTHKDLQASEIYIETVKSKDTHTSLIERVMNNYSAETGEMLTIMERQYIKDKYVKLNADRALVTNSEVTITRQELLLLLGESRSF